MPGLFGPGQLEGEPGQQRQENWIPWLAVKKSSNVWLKYLVDVAKTILF